MKGATFLLATALAGALTLAGCSGAPAGPPGSAGPDTISVDPTFAGTQAEARLIVRIRADAGEGLGTQAVPSSFDHALVYLSGPLLQNPPRTLTLPASQTTGEFANLRPGAGYKLVVALYDAPQPGGKVLASGDSGALALVAGANVVNVTLDLSSAIGLPTPLPLTFSFSFNNATANATGQPASTVVVAGDILKVSPSVTDPNAQLRHVELRLDGTAGANYADGQRLAVWFPDGFSSVLSWNTGAAHVPVVFGTPVGPLPAAPPVPPPAAVAAEGTTNHTLSFLLYDRRAEADKHLIGVKTYNLTVVDPAALNVGIQ